jgi:thiol:disulfide interchange protein DsbD
MRTFALALALLASGPVAAAPWPGATATPGFLSVEQAFPLQITWREEGALLIWRTPPGYALYKQRLSLEIDPQHWRSGPWQIQGLLETDAGAEPAFQERYVGPLVIFIPLVRLQAAGPVPVIHYQGCALQGLCYPPQRTALARP